MKNMTRTTVGTTYEVRFTNTGLEYTVAVETEGKHTWLIGYDPENICQGYEDWFYEITGDEGYNTMPMAEFIKQEINIYCFNGRAHEGKEFEIIS